MSKKETWFFGPGESEFYRAHEGKHLLLKLTDGGVLEAVLLGVDAYHLLVRRRDGVTVLVPKHSIMYVLTREEIWTQEEGDET